MRPEHATDLSQRPTNGSSHNGSSPPTNGSIKSETNGYHTNGHSENAVVLRSKEPFFGHDREEVTRILLQSLSDLGYRGAAAQLSRESGYELEIPSVAAFRTAVLNGEWEEAEQLLFGTDSAEMDGGVVLAGNGHASDADWRQYTVDSLGFSNGSPRHGLPGLPLSEGADVVSLRFFLRQQKYLELLERRDLTAALHVLRTELTPLKTDVGRLHFLSSLVMCPSASDLRNRAEWDGEHGQSRTILLSEISKAISPSVMIPEHRLATLLSSVQEEQIINCRYHNTTVPPSLYTDHDCLAEDFPLHPTHELRNHSDEVWLLEFSRDGTMLATAGRDGLVCVYDTVRWRLKHEFREHERSSLASSSSTSGPSSDERGICSIAFSPDNRFLISCSKTGELVVVNVRNGQRVAYVDHFDYSVTACAWLPDSERFVVGSHGSERPLGLYSLRGNGGDDWNGETVQRNPQIHSWRDPPWNDHLGRTESQANSFRVADCAVNSSGTRMAAATSFNRIMLFSLEEERPGYGGRERERYRKLAEWGMEDKLTSINFSSDGELLLVNMNEGKVLALDSETGEVVQRYEGMVQRDYVIRSCFGGAGEGFVVSGSEDSRVYIWRRQTGMQVAALEAHSPGPVNAVAWHPTNPAIFASAGDDRRVRIWSSAANERRRPDSSSGANGRFR